MRSSSARALLFATLAQVAACASVVADSQVPPPDAGDEAVADAGVIADAPTPADVAADVAADLPPDAASMARVAFAVQGGLGPTDGFAVDLTFLEDGRVFHGFMPDAQVVPEGVGRYRIYGGAEELARLRRQFESDGLLDVPEGVYGLGPTNGVIPWRVTYVRDGRHYRWVVGGEAAPPPLARAIEAVHRASYGLVRE